MTNDKKNFGMAEELVTNTQGNTNEVEELNHLSRDIQNLLTATDIAILLLDQNLQIRHFTPHVNDLFNIAATDKRRPIAELTQKSGYAGLADDANEVLKTATPLKREIQSEAGSWYLVRLRPYHSDGTMNGVVITFVDVSEIKRTEKVLRESQEYYGHIIEGIKEYAIFLLDANGRITSWNSGGQRTFGYRDEEAIGQPVDIIFTPEDRAAGVVTHELETAEKRGSASDDRWLLRQDGTRFWASGVTTALYNNNDALRGFVKLLRDNTWRKEAQEALQASQEELRQLNETLEEQVAARTHQVHLLATELMAAEQAVRQNISQILHDDLQQILYSARMHVQMMRTGVASDEESSEFEQLDKMVERAFVLTRQLASDLTAPIAREPDFAVALEWLVTYMQEMYELTILLTMSGELIIQEENTRHFLFQIIRELLFNIVKHAGVDEAKIKAVCENEMIQIEISDDGVGFDLDTVLESTPPYGGLGLPQIRRRVEFWDGRFDIQTAPGQGTKVIITVFPN